MKRLAFVAIGALLISGSFVTSAGAAPVREDANCDTKKGQATCIGLYTSGTDSSATAKGSTITLRTGNTTGGVESVASATLRNFWDMPLNDVESLRLSILSVVGDHTAGSPRISMYVVDYSTNPDGDFTLLFISPYHCAGFDPTSTAWQTVDFVTAECTIYNSDGTAYHGWDEVLTAMGSEQLYWAFVQQEEGPATNKIKISVS